jgi:hypothetical protein
MQDSESRGIARSVVGVSRRGFLRLAAGGAVVLPGPKPDYASAGQQYENGWDLYPANPVKSWTKGPPGAGSTINVFSNAYNPPSTPLEQNVAWQEVNRQLNANVQFTIVAPADYPAKISTTMAGDDLPDVMLLPGGLNVTIAQSGTANLPQFLQSKCADLTPYLSGDAVKDYPLLAAIPTFAWQNAGCAFGGHLYMLPLQRYVAGRAFFKNTTYYDTEIGKDYVPKDTADLKRVFQQLNRPQEDLLLQYGLQDVHYMLDKTGKLTLNDKSNVDENYVNWKYMMQHPQVMYVPDIPGFAKAEYDAEHYLIPAGANDPTFGLFSPTLGKGGATIDRTMLEGISDIIAARRPMADYDQILKEWAGNGGDQVRTELVDAMASAGR